MFIAVFWRVLKGVLRPFSNKMRQFLLVIRNFFVEKAGGVDMDFLKMSHFVFLVFLETGRFLTRLLFKFFDKTSIPFSCVIV